MKNILSKLLFQTGLVPLYQASMNRRLGNPLRILSLHRVIDPGRDTSALDIDDIQRGCLTLPEFRAGIRYIEKHYRVISLGEAVGRLTTGQTTEPNAVLLTFDDAYTDVLTNALPVLADHKMPFTVFLTSGWIGNREGILTEQQIHELAKSDLATWGAHGVTHGPLTNIDEAEAFDEIDQSRRQVAELTGQPVDFFCYPDGKFNEGVQQHISDAGFTAACATGRTINHGAIDRYVLTRIPFESEPLHRFAFRVAGRT